MRNGGRDDHKNSDKKCVGLAVFVSVNTTHDFWKFTSEGKKSHTCCTFSFSQRIVQNIRSLIICRLSMTMYRNANTKAGVWMYVIICVPVRTVRVWEKVGVHYIYVQVVRASASVSHAMTRVSARVCTQKGEHGHCNTLCIQPQPRTGIPTLAWNLRACGRPDWGYSLARDFAPMSGIWSIVKLGLICCCFFSKGKPLLSLLLAWPFVS